MYVAVELLISDMSLCSLNNIPIPLMSKMPNNRRGNDDAVEEGEYVVSEWSLVQRLRGFENLLRLLQDIPGPIQLDAL